jgi:predicted nucleotidyltransferase component of viral defense system
MTKALEKSIKDKVRQIAAEKDWLFNDVWQIVVLERWLARLATSSYKKHLIFKGGLCLAQYIDLHRVTRDLDFLVRGIDANLDAVREAVISISTLDLKDGFRFSEVMVKTLEHEHMNYPGFGVSAVAKLGTTEVKFFIDLGVGHAVKSKNLTIYLSASDDAPLFEKEIALWAYPIEVIFAEKFETAVSRGGANSRMKDYFDMILLLRSLEMDPKKLKDSIVATFENRKTRLVELKFSQAAGEALQGRWRSFARSIDPIAAGQFSQDFKRIVSEINKALDVFRIF